MSGPGYERAISLISSQLDAAANLLKFASDDLKDLISGTNSIFLQEVLTIAEALQAQASTLTSNAAFLQRIDLVNAGDAEDDSDGGAQNLGA